MPVFEDFRTSMYFFTSSLVFLNFMQKFCDEFKAMYTFAGLLRRKTITIVIYYLLCSSSKQSTKVLLPLSALSELA